MDTSDKSMLFTPNSLLFAGFWDLIMLLLFVINIIVFPLCIGFKLDYEMRSLRILGISSVFLMICEILINLNKTFFYKDSIIRSRKLIFF